MGDSWECQEFCSQHREQNKGGGANSAPPHTGIGPNKNCKTQQGNTADSILVILLVRMTKMRHFSPPNCVSCTTSCVCEPVRTASAGRRDLLTSLRSAVHRSERDYAHSKSGAVNYGGKKKKALFLLLLFL